MKNKKIIRLTESQLKKVIENTINKKKKIVKLTESQLKEVIENSIKEQNKLNILGFSDDEIKSDLKQQRIEKNK